MLGRHGVFLELNEDVEEYEDLTEIMSNVQLNSNFLALAREVSVPAGKRALGCLWLWPGKIWEGILCPYELGQVLPGEVALVGQLPWGVLPERELSCLYSWTSWSPKCQMIFTKPTWKITVRAHLTISVIPSEWSSWGCNAP